MLLFAVLCFPLHCQIFTFLPAVRCSYNKSNADVTPRSLTLLDNRKGRVDFTEGKLRRPGHSRLSATPLITSHFYSAARTSDWPGLRVIVFPNGAVWAPCPSSASTSGRHSQQPAQSVSVTKSCHLSAGVKNCVASPDDLLSRGIQYVSSSRTVLQTVWETQVRSSFWNRVLLRFSSLHPCVLNQREATHKNNHARSVVLCNLEQIQLGSAIIANNVYSGG